MREQGGDELKESRGLRGKSSLPAVASRRFGFARFDLAWACESVLRGQDAARRNDSGLLKGRRAERIAAKAENPAKIGCACATRTRPPIKSYSHCDSAVVHSMNLHVRMYKLT